MSRGNTVPVGAPGPVVVTPSTQLLAEVQLLRRFTPDELDGLARLGTPLAFEAHANIIIEGELSWGLYLLLEGSVGIYKSNKMTGDSHDLAHLASGSSFGEMSLIDDDPRSATVRALTDCRLFHLSKEAFNGFLEQSPERKLRFYHTCVQDLVSRLRDLDENHAITQYQLWKAAVKREAA